ncbi:MAG TPA: nucleotide-binding domain containing protein, partial [Elusimicrobiota bacterium]|nr:nucleotide-binding domain containing protein [Elusimicrobiota bacterium]
LLLRRFRRNRRGFEVRRYVVTGGETAFRFVRLLGRGFWRVADRVERGLPLCVEDIQRSPRRRPCWMVLKPGGFGSETALIKSVRRLQRVL